MFLPARYLAAVDAVAGPGGSVVCRSAVAQASGCAPFDVFGAVALSQQALDYIDPPAVGIYSLTNERQDVFSLSINGTPFRDWAGDMALAFGAEYREEAYRTLADPYGDGVSPSNPFTRDYPADPILNANGNNWYAGNFHHGGGNYHVFEAFAEADAPLFNTMRLGRADLNVAGRATEYSTSGFVDTWKIGITWNMPMDGVRLRALQSRDVRAPNLSELFAAPIITNAGVTNRLLPATAPNVAVLNDAIGNPNLKPETAQTTDIGLIFQPSYFPRLNLSIDYYRVNAKKQIGVLTSQQEVDLCQIYGNASYCNQFYLNGAAGTSNPNYVIVRPFNLTETTTDGFDVEMRYQFELHDFGIPGDFILRNLATHVSKYIVDTGVIGQPVAEFAGAQVSAAPASSQFQSGVPLWKIFLNQSWDVAPLSFNITERIFSNTVLNPYGTVCQAPNCPPSTAQTPTYSEMNAPGYIYVDVGMSYQISKSWQTYLGINNVGDSLPKAFAPLNSDPVGRVFRFGVRFNN
jgi:outer membrane receptor protein involved in Fe transport